MTDYTELKRLATAAQYEKNHYQHELVASTKAFFEGCIPEQILEILAELERLREDPSMRAIRSLRGDCKDLMVEHDQLKAAFKNFHRSLCERFGYYHDDIDWQRDQASLEEHIAALFGHVSAENGALRAQSETVQRGAGQLKAENEALRKALGDLLALYEDDEGCRGMPEYIAGRAAMGKGEQP